MPDAALPAIASRILLGACLAAQREIQTTAAAPTPLVFVDFACKVAVVDEDEVWCGVAAQLHSAPKHVGTSALGPQKLRGEQGYTDFPDLRNSSSSLRQHLPRTAACQCRLLGSMRRVCSTT